MDPWLLISFTLCHMTWFVSMKKWIKMLVVEVLIFPSDELNYQSVRWMNVPALLLGGWSHFMCSRIWKEVIFLAFFPYFSRFYKFDSLFIWIHSFNMTPRGLTWCHVITFGRLRAHFVFYPPWNKNEWISESKHLIYQNQLRDISWLVSWSWNLH